MNVNIDEYLSKDEISEICKEALRDAILSVYSRESQVQRLLTNLSYDIVTSLVNEVMDGDMKEFVKQKTIEVIGELGTFTVFRNKDLWDKEDSVAMAIVKEESEKARPLIKKRVEEIINAYHFGELKREDISYTIAEVISERLFERSHEV